MTGSAPPPAAETDEKATPRRRRLRLWVAVVAGVLGILCAGGIGVAVLLYDEETKIDRSQPDIVADHFLIAYLANRDDSESKLYTCKSPTLMDIENLRNQLIAREKEFGVRVSVSWGALTRVAVGEGQEDVSTELAISGSSGGQITSSRTENWRLRIVDDGGAWRVCSAAKIA